MYPTGQLLCKITRMKIFWSAKRSHINWAVFHDDWGCRRERERDRGKWSGRTHTIFSVQTIYEIIIDEMFLRNSLYSVCRRRRRFIWLRPKYGIAAVDVEITMTVLAICWMGIFTTIYQRMAAILSAPFPTSLAISICASDSRAKWSSTGFFLLQIYRLT